MVPLSENVNPWDEDGASLPLRVIDSLKVDVGDGECVSGSVACIDW